MTRDRHALAQVLVVMVAVSGLLVAGVVADGPAGPTDVVDVADRGADMSASDLIEPSSRQTDATRSVATAQATDQADATDQAASATRAADPTTDPTAVPDAERDPEPVAPGLPVCTYDDLPTRFAAPGDWPRTLLDTQFALSQDYHPDDLVPVGAAGVEGWGEIRALVVDDLRAMDEAARAAGAGFAVRSAFRDFATQRDIFQRWVATIGEAGALGESARPGHSEHQLGTALDLRSADSATPGWDYPDWGQTPTGTWLRENSWQYGFVLSYPEGESAFTCYDYESWHFRYVGREMAAAMQTSGLTPREHLWRTSEGLP